MDQKIKELIDSMPYEHMLNLWRFSPAGYYLFQGETGKYFSEVMKEKASNLSEAERVNTSKSVGWDKP